MRVEPIDDADDPRIAAFRDIRERDLVRSGDFIAEGAVVLDHLLTASLFEPLSILVSEHRIGGLLPRLQALGTEQVPILVCPQAVMDRIAGFSVHRGILAHGRRRAGRAPDEWLAETAGPVLAAFGISNHDNMGSLFRNAAAFGCAGIMLDETSCDPLYRKAIRVSVGTVLKVPFARFASAGAALDRLESAGYGCVALTPWATVDLAEWAPPDRVALVVGAEGDGLPPEVIARCRGLRIEMAPGLDSLNVATSAAIALHAAFTRRGIR
ncbi:RNA methyltransferase [Aureimonas altamirensis]|uniref:TrmH family RNA methyltransferase n=1 Tax=Aureimonas altamirensis TaxID=370622 RepID=UPI001E43B9E8|nr:RNA methyltransferase [Aureimonas altamirensis]UHD47269.1 RNA methyltransferase [Aureimonas altamirensis]